MLQLCTVCKTYRHPPSPICPNCLSDRAEWIKASGKGTVYTFTIVRQALARGWEERIPYVVAVITLDEGPTFLTNLVNVHPDAVMIGMPVVVTFSELDGETKLPLFEPQYVP